MSVCYTLHNILLCLTSLFTLTVSVTAKRELKVICNSLTNSNKFFFSSRIKDQPDVTCYFIFTSYVLNMFRILIYPSSGACDYSVELPHFGRTVL